MKPDKATRQLADTTLELLSQNRLLEDLCNDLHPIVRKFPPAGPAARGLRERVGRLPHQSIDWGKYERQFSEIFPDFFQTLRERAPKITSTGMRICTMVRMRLKSREIAILLGISESGVAVLRGNIRRKLKMKKEKESGGKESTQGEIIRVHTFSLPPVPTGATIAAVPE